MGQPNAPEQAAPVSKDASAEPVTKDTKGPETPPSPVGTPAPAVADAKKPANQLEAELASQFDEGEWDNLPQKVKDRMIAAEMKTREADKRMQLAAKLKKDLDMTNSQVNQLIEALKKDPWRVLSNPALGHDVRKLAESYVWDMIQEQRMSPEQREAMQTKMELQELKAQQEQAKKDQADREMQELIAQRRAYWEKTIPEAIESAGLPKTSYTVRRFAEYIKAAARSRIPADMPAIANHIRQELVDLQSRFLLPPKSEKESQEQYEERILSSAPNDYVKMLRKADLRKLRAKGMAPKPGPKPASAPAAKPNNGKMLMSEWIAQREGRLGR